MARIVRNIKVDRRSNRTILSFRSGGQKYCLEIAGGAKEFREWINEQMSESAELVVAMGLKQWLEKNPGSNDFESITSTTVTLNLDAGTITSVKE